jgi:chromosome segregation ATPase
MRIDELPDQHERFLDQARGVLGQEVAEARQSLAALNAEKATAQAAVSALQDQRKVAQAALDAVLSDLNRASGLAGLGAELAEARQKLRVLTAETEKISSALEKLVRERAEAEHQRDAVLGEMQRLRQERAEATAEIDKIKALVKSFEFRRTG